MDIQVSPSDLHTCDGKSPDEGKSPSESKSRRRESRKDEIMARRLESELQIADDSEFIIHGDRGISYGAVLRYYASVFGLACLLSIPAIAVIYIVSALPWTRDIHDYPNYVNGKTVVGVLNFAICSFGPIYISAYTYIILRSLDRIYIVHVIVHLVFWPTLYTGLEYSGIHAWFYYLDFIYFGLGFLPISIHAAHLIKQETRFVMKYAFCELFVIVSALGYSFFLFPVFIQQPDWAKIIWRLTLHPIWFEFTMVLPQRILTKKEEFCDDKYKKFLPSLHAIFHNVTIGRMLLLSVNNIYLMIVLCILTNVEESIMRMTVMKRDGLFIRILYGSHDDDLATHGCIVNIEMLFELIGIITSPFMMNAFAKYEYMFVFNGQMATSSKSIGNIVVVLSIQLLPELVTDIICSMYEVYRHRIDLLDIWNRMITREFIAFALYGIITMGIFGMIYTSLVLPRSAFCAEYNILTCSYSPVTPHAQT